METSSRLCNKEATYRNTTEERTAELVGGMDFGFYGFGRLRLFFGCSPKKPDK